MPGKENNHKTSNKKYLCDLIWIVKNYAIESTGHGFKYIVSEPGTGSKLVWVIMLHYSFTIFIEFSWLTNYILIPKSLTKNKSFAKQVMPLDKKFTMLKTMTTLSSIPMARIIANSEKMH